MTSPPYWGLRDYGVKEQIGLEKHPHEYIHKLAAIFHDLKRVLKPHGSFYLNLGDTYCSTKGSCFNAGGGPNSIAQAAYKNLTGYVNPNRMLKPNGAWLQPKQLLMIPARIAIALQEDGWILRNAIIWFKPNGLPSSVKDRLANKYEHVFHFVKSRRYYYDLDAIRVPQETLGRAAGAGRARNHQVYNPHDSQHGVPLGFQSPGGMVEAARTQRRKGALRLLRLDGKNPGDVEFFSGANTGANNKEPYRQNNPHLARLLCGHDAMHPAGKNPGDVVAGRDKTDGLQKLNSMRNPPEPDEPNAFHPLGKNPGDLLELDGQIFPEGQSPAYRYGSRRNKWSQRRKTEEGVNSFACWKAARPRTINAGGKNPGDIYGSKEDFAFWKAIVLEEYARIGKIGCKRFSGKHELLHENSANFRLLLNSGRTRNSVYSIIEKLRVSEELKQQLKNWWHDHSSYWLGPNPGDFWKITTKPFPEAHFAVYPEELCVRPIKSSCPAQVCKSCGKPSHRVVAGRLPGAFNIRVRDKQRGRLAAKWGNRVKASQTEALAYDEKTYAGSNLRTYWKAVAQTRGMPTENVVAHVPGGHTGLKRSFCSTKPIEWKSCKCAAGFEPGNVFDPFAGAGTTLVVAKKLGRQWLGCELNPKFVKMAERRLTNLLIE